MSKATGKNTKSAFSLLELTVVLVVVGVVTTMAMTSGSAVVGAAREKSTRQKMKDIEDALVSFRETNNRLPCPADITIADNATNYGVEAATPGTCTGGTPAANHSAAGATNTGKTGVEGGVPVVTLGLPNDYMYDGWGKRIRYAVDRSVTAVGGFASVPATCTDRAITIKDASGGNRTTGAVYALISHGLNGHGGYSKQGTVTNAASTNTDEQTNCHCDASAVASTYAPTYVQKAETVNTASATDSYDDIVVYKERWQLMVSWERLGTCAPVYVYVVDMGNSRIQKLDSDGNYVTKWGSAGSGNGQFTFSYTNQSAIAVDASGNVLVADIDNDRIQKFDSNGNYISQFGTYGSADGQLNGPNGLAVDSSGNIWVSEYWGQRVQKFDSSGNHLLKFGTSGSGDGQFNYPATVAIYGNYVYVGDHNNYRVQKFDLNGNFVSVFYSGSSPQIRPLNGMDFDSTGNLYIANSWSWQIDKLNSAGAYQTTYSGYGWANGYVQSNPAVAVDAQDKLWVVDPGNSRIQKFDSTGTWMASFGGGIGHSCTTTPEGDYNGCPEGSANRQFDAPIAITTNKLYINASR